MCVSFFFFSFNILYIIERYGCRCGSPVRVWRVRYGERWMGQMFQVFFLPPVCPEEEGRAGMRSASCCLTTSALGKGDCQLMTPCTICLLMGFCVDFKSLSFKNKMSSSLVTGEIPSSLSTFSKRDRRYQCHVVIFQMIFQLMREIFWKNKYNLGKFNALLLAFTQLAVLSDQQKANVEVRIIFMLLSNQCRIIDTESLEM